jgi:26S proteasome regulatory subunit RPN2 C-terminal domain
VACAHITCAATHHMCIQSFTQTCACRYWYPLSYFSSLMFQPTAMIGLNGDLQLPKFSLQCNIKPSVFAYPPPIPAEAAQEVCTPALWHTYPPTVQSSLL